MAIDMQTIAVICDDPRHPKRRVVRIGLFGRRPDRENAGWEAWPGTRNTVTELLDDADNPLGGPFVPSVPGEAVRGRYELSCNLCPERVEARAEVLGPVLTELYKSGRTVVGLTDLGAILGQ